MTSHLRFHESGILGNVYNLSPVSSKSGVRDNKAQEPFITFRVCPSLLLKRLMTVTGVPRLLVGRAWGLTGTSETLLPNSSTEAPFDPAEGYH